MTVFELLHGVHRAGPEKRAVREAYVENALQTFPILPFDEAAARVFAGIDASLSAAGNRLAVEDLMIAATALAKGHDVITRDVRSFRACQASDGPNGRTAPIVENLASFRRSRDG